MSPIIKTYGVWKVGTFDDWYSTIPNKVQAVAIAGVGRPPDPEPNDPNHFIYVDSDGIPQNVLIGLWKDGPIIQSDPLPAPEYPELEAVTIFSTTKPGGGDWTVPDVNATELHIADPTNNLEQAFKSFRVKVPLGETWNIVSVGFRAIIQSGALLDARQLRVLYVEKEISYFVE